MKKSSCAILGSPPLSFPWGYDEEDSRCTALKLMLFNKITFLRGQGVTGFYVVMDAGIGLYAAEIICGLRDSDSDLRLVCVIPWEEQANKWTPELRDRYYTALGKCDDVRMISTAYSPVCEIAAMLNAIDASDRVIAVRGEAHPMLFAAMHYADQLHRYIITLDAN